MSEFLVEYDSIDSVCVCILMLFCDFGQISYYFFTVKRLEHLKSEFAFAFALILQDTGIFTNRHGYKSAVETTHIVGLCTELCTKETARTDFKVCRYHCTSMDYIDHIYLVEVTTSPFSAVQSRM